MKPTRAHLTIQAIQASQASNTHCATTAYIHYHLTAYYHHPTTPPTTRAILATLRARHLITHCHEHTNPTPHYHHNTRPNHNHHLLTPPPPSLQQAAGQHLTINPRMGSPLLAHLLNITPNRAAGLITWWQTQQP